MARKRIIFEFKIKKAPLNRAVLCTQGRGRTGTSVTSLVFETNASTNSATWAFSFSGSNTQNILFIASTIPIVIGTATWAFAFGGSNTQNILVIASIIPITIGTATWAFWFQNWKCKDILFLK